MDLPPVAKVIEYLLTVSECKDVEDLLHFACTLSVVPGTTGNTKYQVASAFSAIRRGEVPDILESWYRILNPAP